MGEDSKYQRLAPVLKEIKELKQALGCGSQEAYHYLKKCRDSTDLYLLKQRIIPFEGEVIASYSGDESNVALLITEGMNIRERGGDDRLNYQEEMDWQDFMYKIDEGDPDWHQLRYWWPIVSRARRIDLRKD